MRARKMWPAMGRVKLFDDPTPEGVICQRFLQHSFFTLASATDLSQDEKEDLFDVLLLVAKKMVAVWRHYQNYLQHEDRLLESSKSRGSLAGTASVELEPSQELFIEFDEFLMQVKSCLDYLVNVPAVILGRKRWNLATFGSKGADVVKALENNLPKDLCGRASNVICIVQESMPWVGMAVDARDKMGHFLHGGIRFELFTVALFVKGGQTVQCVPMWSKDQTIRQFLASVWQNLFLFSERFVAALLYLRMPGEIVLVNNTSPIPSAEPAWCIAPRQVMDCLGAKLVPPGGPHPAD